MKMNTACRDRKSLTADGPRRNPTRQTMEIVRLYAASPHLADDGHDRQFFATPMFEQPIVRVEPGCGIVGGHFSEAIARPKGHVTFFVEEVWLRLLDELEVPAAKADPGVLRRNIVVRHADLLALIGTRFEFQGVRFKGARYCEPGSWMDDVLWPGTMQLLTKWKAGGLRTVPLTGGILVCDAESRESWDCAP